MQYYIWGDNEMKLEVNKEHKKIRYGKMNKPFQKFNVPVNYLKLSNIT